MTALRISSISLLSIIVISVILSSVVMCFGSEPKPAFDGEIVRLHVIANSDTDFDQQLKLKVRDSVLKVSNNTFATSDSAEISLALAKENTERMKEEALKTIREEGYNYDVKISTGVFPFPAKTYGDLIFPAGDYNAVRVIIGEGKGQNWWCVMFPPLCFVNETKGEMPESSKNMLSEETKDILNGREYKIKFKLAEIF